MAIDPGTGTADATPAETLLEIEDTPEAKALFEAVTPTEIDGEPPVEIAPPVVAAAPVVEAPAPVVAADTPAPVVPADTPVVVQDPAEAARARALAPRAGGGGADIDAALAAP